MNPLCCIDAILETVPVLLFFPGLEWTSSAFIHSSATENEEKKKRNLRYATAKQTRREDPNFEECLMRFKKACKDTPIHPCICCHRMMFKKGVKEFNEKVAEKIGDDLLKMSCMTENDTTIDTFKVRGKLYLCSN